MATPVSIDQNTSLPIAHFQTEPPILLKRLIYLQVQCYRLSIPTLRARLPARMGLLCPQRHTCHTRASILAPKKGSNAIIPIATMHLLVETILRLISRHTMKETPLCAVNGILIVPASWLLSLTKSFQSQDVCLSRGSPFPRPMQHAWKRALYYLHTLVCYIPFLVS